MNVNPADVPVIILAGGYGIYIDDSGVRKSKGNVVVSGQPIIYYVILSYLKKGFRTFYITGSYQLDETKKLLQKSFGAEPTYNKIKFNITFKDSGMDALTGDRVKSIFAEIQSCEHFAVTYSDTVSSHDLLESLQFHIDSKKMGTLTGTRLPTRFRILGTRPGETVVRGFSERPINKGDYINGGFYFFSADVRGLSVWASKNKLTLEVDVLDNLVELSELSAYVFEGDWHHIDCERDIAQLQRIVTRHLS